MSDNGQTDLIKEFEEVVPMLMKLSLHHKHAKIVIGHSIIGVGRFLKEIANVAPSRGKSADEIAPLTKECVMRYANHGQPAISRTFTLAQIFQQLLNNYSEGPDSELQKFSDEWIVSGKYEKLHALRCGFSKTISHSDGGISM